MSSNRKKLFCIECGKLLDKNEIINGLCIECYRKFYSLFDVNDVKVDVCRKCLAFKHRDKWVRVKTYELEDVVQQILQIKTPYIIEKHGRVEISFGNINFEKREKDTITAVVEAVGVGKPSPNLPVYEERKTLKLHLHFTVCQKCAQITREHFKAIIQLRGEPEKVDKALNTTLQLAKSILSRREKDNEAFITKIKKTRGGIDIYFGSSRIARMIAYKLRDDLGAKIVETRKIVSKDRQTSKNVYQQTFSVRLLPFKKGDLLQVDEHILLVLEDLPSRGKLKVFNVISGREEKLPIKIFWREDVKNIIQDKVERFMVVSISKKHVTLMNLQNYSSLEIDKDDIPFKVTEGEEIEAIKLKGKLYLLPKIMKKE